MNQSIQTYFNQGGILILKNLDNYRITLEQDTLKIEKPRSSIHETMDKAKTLWYMNGNKEDILKWSIYQKHGFVTTWNHNCQNDRLKKKLEINDIIAWYIVGKGYNSILQVHGPVHEITEREMDLLVNEKEKQEWKRKMCEHEYKVLVIPVKFLSTLNDEYLNHEQFPAILKEHWTFGLRGSHCIKPKNSEWKQQVFSMYTFMKNSFIKNNLI